MDTAILWLVIFGMTLVTFLPRLSVIALLRREALPPGLARALRFVPPAALSAIIFPALVMPDGTPDLSTANARLLTGLVAAIVAWRSRNTLLTIGVGMLLLWLLQAV